MDEDDRYWTRPTGSSSSSADTKQHNVTFLGPVGRNRSTWIAGQARLVFGSYRRDDFADPETFLMQLGRVLERYSDEVITEVTSPTSGVQRHCKFPPSIAEVVEACEAENARLLRIERYNSMGGIAARRPPGFVPQKCWATLFVPIDAPQYRQLLERTRDGDPREWCYDATRPGIWVIPDWLWGAPRKKSGPPAGANATSGP
jgi:hypothetical protein